MMAIITEARVKTIIGWLIPGFERMRTENAWYRETFVQDQYGWLADKLKPDTMLLDFGAAAGDTALYFARMKEVKSIYSYEIDKKAYKWAVDNIEKSPHKDKISIHNIDAKTVKIDGFNDKNIAVKCDVEGAEYGMFTEDVNLNNVYAIQMEFHNKIRNEHLKLTKLLNSQGFRTEVHDLHDWKHPVFKELGFIYAWK